MSFVASPDFFFPGNLLLDLYNGVFASSNDPSLATLVSCLKTDDSLSPRVLLRFYFFHIGVVVGFSHHFLKMR